MLRSFKADIVARCEAQRQRRAILDAKTGRVWTYEALWAAIEGMSAVLAARGIQSGSRMVSVLPSGIEQFVGLLATWWLGADFCPISPLSTVDETCRFARLCHATGALIPNTADAAMAASLRAATAAELLIPCALDGDMTRFVPATSRRSSATGAAGKLILFTSGTASNPKAMMLDGDRLWSSAVAWSGFHPCLNTDARFYNILPMSYLGGLFNLGLIPLACHGSVVMSDAFSAMSAVRFWREVKEHRVNILWCSPTILRTLVAVSKRDVQIREAAAQVRACFVGMSLTHPGEKEQWEEIFGMSVLENYALSETTFLTTETSAQDGLREPGSVGGQLPWVECRIRPSDNVEVGEIEVKTPFLFDGYLDQHGHVDCPLTTDGFFSTGDLGSLTSNGVLRLRGRTRDIVKKGGYLLLLQELEEVAMGHAAIHEAAAIGVPHDYYGESVILGVCVRQQITVTPLVLQEIAAYLAVNLAKYKWPDCVVALTEFPKTESGKVMKYKLLETIRANIGVLGSATVK